MKLFYSAGSCSTSCHITLEESGLKYEATEVDWDKPGATEEVAQLNPLGTLPVLKTDNGTTLTQNIAIHTHIADQAPEKGLLPPTGTLERATVMNWLSFVCSDLHKAFSPLFALERISPDKNVQHAVRTWATGEVKGYLSFLDKNLTGKDYLTGKTFTVADAYAFVVVNWTQWVGISIEEYKNLKIYLARVAERPAVKKVWKEEGLAK